MGKSFKVHTLSSVSGTSVTAEARGLTASEANAYLMRAGNDELHAAIDLAVDRGKRTGSREAPDEIEIHHAFFLLRRARGMQAPSFDAMRVDLRSRTAASAA